MAWQMPVYRKPTSLEITINEWVCWSQELFDYSLKSNDMLAHWWYHPYRQALSWFSIVIWVSALWFACSTIASWRASQAEASRETSQPVLQAESSIEPHPSSIHKAMTDFGVLPQTPPRSKSKAIIDGANLNSLPSVPGNFIPIDSSTHIDNRTGRVSTPGYQTPFVNVFNRRNFSSLAKNAPISYDTLRRNGLLDAKGAPTKKYSPATHSEGSISRDEELQLQSEEASGNLGRSAVAIGRLRFPIEAYRTHWPDDESDEWVRRYLAANRNETES